MKDEVEWRKYFQLIEQYEKNEFLYNALHH